MPKPKTPRPSGKKIDAELSRLQERVEQLEQTGVRQLEQRQKLVIQLLEILNHPGERKDTIRRILLLIKEFTGIECVAIRLKDGADYPYYVTNGFPEDFVEAERYLCARDHNGNIIKDAGGNPALECMCGNILQGRTDPKYPFFTNGGSFWSNCTTQLLASTTEQERQARTRNRCNGEGYESVALIPLRINSEVIGLLQLNDTRKNMFRPEMINFFERIGSAIGIAFKRTKLEEERFRNTLDNMLEGAQIIGSDWKYIYVNDAAARQGKQPKQNLIGKTMMECYPGIDQTEMFAALKRSMTERTHQRLENRFNFPDGSAGWFELAIHPVPEGVFILSLDISDIKRAETELKHLNAVLKAIRNVNQLITRERNRDRLLQEACDKLIETRGYASAWIALFDRAGRFTTGAQAGLGQDFDRLIETFKAGKLPDCVRDTLKTRSVRVIIDADSFCRQCPVHAKYPGKKLMLSRLEYNDVIYGILAIAALAEAPLDAEEQSLFQEVVGDLSFALSNMETEQLHQRAEEDLVLRSLLLDNTTDSVFLHDSDGRFLYVNKAGYQTRGYTRDEFMAMRLADLDTPEYGKLIQERMKQVIEKGGHIFEAVHICKDGSIMPVEVHSSPIKIKGNQCFLAIIRDITHKKKEEAEKTKLQNQLLRAQKLESIGTLAGGVAHDFNNILTSIKGYAEMLLQEMDASNPIYESISHINQAVDRGSNLTRQLLLFSRKDVTDIKTVNLNELITDTLKMLGRLIGEHIKIETKLAADAAPILADHGNIEQVITNLTVNARDAMPKGGKITITTENASIDEKYCQMNLESRCGRFVCLAIADTGVGMTDDVKSRIFEPFFTTKEAGKGTGLGLSVVHGIVKKHQGWVNVYSEPGQGAIFRIYLPAAPAKEGLPKHETKIVPPKELQGHGERILLVEDDKGVQKVALTTLTKMGYNVFAASTGNEAIELFNKEKGDFHLLLSDVVLPDGNGIDLAAELRLLKPDLKVLMTSGYPSKQSYQEQIKERQLPFIAKPYKLSNLFAKIKELLRKED